MSRIGKLPISIPSGVTITVDPDFITVAGSKGTLKQFTMEGVNVEVKDSEVSVTRVNDEPKIRAKHGLMRALINNMVQGVSAGFRSRATIDFLAIIHFLLGLHSQTLDVIVVQRVLRFHHRTPL